MVGGVEVNIIILYANYNERNESVNEILEPVKRGTILNLRVTPTRSEKYVPVGLSFRTPWMYQRDELPQHR